MVTYYFVYLLETIRCDTATVYLLYRISSAQIYTHLQNISGLVWSGYSLIWNSPDLLIMFHRLLFKAKFIKKKKKKTLRLNLEIKIKKLFGVHSGAVWSGSTMFVN